MEKADKRIHESSPAYSLGVKHKEPKQEDIPGNKKLIVKITFHDFRFLIKYPIARMEMWAVTEKSHCNNFKGHIILEHF